MITVYAVTEDKFLLLKRHICSDGLSDEVVREIAEASEMVRFEPGETLHRANEPFESVFFLIHGRVRQSIVDTRGNILIQRQQSAGVQFGALACALGKPAPLDLVAEEPSTLLRIDYQTVLRLTQKHEDFRNNYSKLIADAVLQLIMKDREQKKPRIVGVFHESPATRAITRRLIERLKQLGESPHVFTDQSDWRPIEDVPDFCLVKEGRLLPPADIQHQGVLWADSKRTFFDVATSFDAERLLKMVEVCEKVFWCVTPENWRESVPRLNAVLKDVPNWRDKINIVWQLPGDCRFAPWAPELNDLAKRNFKLSFEEPAEHQSRELKNGFERIVHQLRGVRIGVALGGGAARGMAHLGVLKVLEENGIVVDMIAGTSVGAMTGILYASGMEPDYNVDCFANDLKPPWLFRHLPNGGYWYLLYKYRTGQFDPMLRKYLNDSRLEQLTIPVQSITVDLVSGQPIVRSGGDAVHAITESINLPGLSIPINRDGRSLVDGGIVNNVPADVLVACGCNIVIAASVTANIEPEFASNRFDTPTAQMKPASFLKTMLRTYLVQNMNMNSVGVAPADFVIQPDVSGFDLTEFERAEELSVIGAEATSNSLPKLKQLLADFDPQLFGDS